MQSWIYLGAAILMEIVGTTSLKLSQGFSRMLPSILTVVFYSLAFLGLSLALRKIELSVAYAVWSGVGTALVACIGFMFFREPVTLLKLTCIGLIILGVVGLHGSNASP